MLWKRESQIHREVSDHLFHWQCLWLFSANMKSWYPQGYEITTLAPLTQPSRKNKQNSLLHLLFSKSCAHFPMTQNLRGTIQHRIKINLCNVVQDSLNPPNLNSTAGHSSEVLPLHNQQSHWRADFFLSVCKWAIYYQ